MTDSDVGIAFIYCNYKEEQTAEELLGSLFQQLIHQRPTISNDVRQLYQIHRKTKTMPSINEYSASLQSEIRCFKRCFLVIDALDECTERKGIRGSILSEFRKLQPTLRLLITSRPHIEDVQNAFEDPVQLEIMATEGDIKLYLEGRIERERRLKHNVERDPSLKVAITDTILSKVKGMSYP